MLASNQHDSVTSQERHLGLAAPSYPAQPGLHCLHGNLRLQSNHLVHAIQPADIFGPGREACRWFNDLVQPYNVRA